MKKHTMYEVVLKDGRHIKAKTLAKLRRFASQIVKIWKVWKIKKDSTTICSYSRFYLDKALRRLTKGKYKTKYMNDAVWVLDSEKPLFSSKITPRLWLRIQRQTKRYEQR